MEIKTQRFVTLSELFKDCPSVAEAFREDDHNNFTWGDCNRSMISIPVFESWFCHLEEDEEASLKPQEIETVATRLNSLDDEVLIDLEN